MKFTLESENNKLNFLDFTISINSNNWWWEFTNQLNELMTTEAMDECMNESMNE